VRYAWILVNCAWILVHCSWDNLINFVLGFVYTVIKHMIQFSAILRNYELI